MIVSFPACGPTAKYNYARTLNGVNCWRLFIKDDFGDEHTGNYLVEEKTERVVIGLIDHQIQKRNINRLFFIGSSKGAYSAINFSFHFPHVTVVAGGPQYYLADYLKKCNALSSLHDILGDNYSEESFERLNCRLKEKILKQKIVPNAIYLHYSNKEHTYEEHIKDMLETLNKRGIRVYEDVCDYPYHSGLADYFPPFLKRTIKAIL